MRIICAICGKINSEGSVSCAGCRADLWQFARHGGAGEGRREECGAALDDGKDGRCPGCGARGR